MYLGKIVELADRDRLYKEPQHPYTRALLRSLPRVDGSRSQKLESIEGLPPDLIMLPRGCPFAPRCTYVKDKCLEVNPPLEEISGHHKIACWVNVDTGDLR